MKWIEYDYLCNEKLGITLHKKVEYNEVNLSIAKAESYDGTYEITQDDEPSGLAPLPVSLGGTGSTDAASARAKLGITPANIGALPRAGGSMTGAVTMKGIKLTSGIDYGISLPSKPATGQLFFLDATVADELGL